MAMKKTMIYLTEQQQLILRQRASEKGVSVASLIRDAVDEYIVREKPQVDYLAIVGMAAGAAGERTSERVDETLAAAMRKGGAGATAKNAKGTGRKAGSGVRKKAAGG